MIWARCPYWSSPGKLYFVHVSLHSWYRKLHFNDARAYDQIYSVGSTFTKPEYYYKYFNRESSFGYIDVKEAKQRKDVMRPLFSRRAILKLEGVIQSCVGILVDQLVSALLSHDKNTPVNLFFGYLSTSMEIITTYCFARSYGVVSFPRFEHPTLRAIKSFGLIFYVMQHFPFTAPFIKDAPAILTRKLNPSVGAYSLFKKDLTSQIDALLDDPAGLDREEHEIIYHHLLNPKEGTMRPSRQSLFDEAHTLVMAGTDTVGNTSAFGTFKVLSDSGILERLVNELRGAWPDVETMVGYETLEKLPYLTAVIKESLRMTHGVLSPLPRIVHSPAIIAGVAVPTNTVVSMGASFMHQNPIIFPNPLEFRPERWLGNNNDHLHEMEQHLVPFSKGYAMPLLGFGVYQNYTTRESVLEAFKAGYRHVDSAQVYRNEAHVGEAVHESGLPREDLFITTKCVSKTHGYESTLKGIDTSLSKFGFDYIDLFLIHDPYSGTERRLATYKALQEAKASGKIRTVGVSNYGVKHLEEIRNAGFPMPSVNQIEQRPIVSYCREHNIVVQAYCPIVRGKMDHPQIIALATKYNRDPAQILIRWSLQKGFVPLPKSATPARIHSNTELYDFDLADEDITALDALDRGKDGAESWNPVDAD
ncbi:hypothetical protein DXG01_013632 [Tephrocybe rancida]|nr:hypothetical protein DXG01_013632 [Tephrocybe rancida]